MIKRKKKIKMKKVIKINVWSQVCRLSDESVEDIMILENSDI